MMNPPPPTAATSTTDAATANDGTTASGGTQNTPISGAYARQYPPRVPLHADEPSSLAEMFERIVAAYHKPDVLNYKRDRQWRAISSDEFITRARHIALGLYALGLRRNERVGLLSENCPEWTLTDAGCQLSGVIDVPIYSTQAPPQVCYILNDSGARVLIIQHRAAYERIAEAIRGCTAIEHVVFLLEDTAPEDVPNSLTLAELEVRGATLAAEQPALAAELARQVGSEDIATIIYTSGTTGEPKGVMLTQSNLITNLIDVAERLDFGAQDIALSVLPLSHVFERVAMYMYLCHGLTVFYAEGIDKIGDNMREVRPTLLVAVPRLFEKIYAKIQEKAAAGGRVKAAMLAWAVGVGKRWAQTSLAHRRVPPLLALQHKIATRLVFSKWHAGVGGRARMFVSGGAALPEEIGYIFAGAGLPIVQGYGLTETSPVIAANTLEDNRIGTVGRPIRNVEVRIAADGEIEVRGPNIMLGYYNKPDATRDVFTADGWFKTGDIGKLDAEGFLSITDRKKELFKTSGGKYIAPQPIEQRIKQSRFVNQVVLIGNGRKFPAALVVPDWEQLRAYAQLKGLDCKTPAEFCSNPRIIDLLQRQIDGLTADLSNYERVKKVALLERELTIEGGELTPTLKIKRRILDDKYRDVIDELYKE